MITSNSPVDFTKLLSQEDSIDFTKSPEFHDWLVEILSNTEPVKIEFLKKDGTTREMTCTRNMALVPAEFHPKESTTTEGAAIRVFDLDKQEWRSFLAENLKRINYAI